MGQILNVSKSCSLSECCGVHESLLYSTEFAVLKSVVMKAVSVLHSFVSSDWYFITWFDGGFVVHCFIDCSRRTRMVDGMMCALWGLLP